MKKKKVLFILLVVILIVIGLYLENGFLNINENTAENNSENDSINYSSDTYNDYNESINSDEQGKDNISSKIWHYGKIPITFSFSDTCGSKVRERVNFAFNFLTSSTNETISFQEDNLTNDSELIITCGILDSTSNDYYTLGEGQVKYYYPDNLEILQSEASFRSISKNSYSIHCSNFPFVELHEILHTFGIAHNEDKGDIMNSVVNPSCLYNKINDKYITCLKSIYSNSDLNCTGVNFITSD